jgi:nucleoside-diphosphate-sugar epimerase
MKVCVLGANGFIGSNLLRDTDWTGVTHQQLDLTVREDVDAFFTGTNFDVVVHCAVVGGSRLQTDSSDVCYKNILMFENVARHVDKFGKLVYFSSGAAKRGSPPTDPYGFSKWLIDKRIASMGPNVYSMCIWGCYGPGEPPTRFSAVCKRDGHVVIPKDRYFDFIDVNDVKKIVYKYCVKGGQKFSNLVGTTGLKLSEWATKFGATHEILEEGLDTPYAYECDAAPWVV